MIDDIRHSIIQRVRKLRKKEHRQKTGQVIVEGYPEVKRAYEAGVPFRETYICRELLSENIDFINQLKVTDVSKDVFAAMAFGSRLKGILAVCQPKVLELSDLKLKANPLVVILENVEKPGNLGGVIRTCDGAGVDAVIMCDGKTDIYNQHVVRSSIGTVFTVPTLSAGKEEILSFLKQHRVNVFTATSQAAELYTDADYSRPAALLIGNEHDGLSPYWMKHTDQSVKIPMLGQGRCLNASVSAAILIYEAVRQRQLKAC